MWPMWSGSGTGFFWVSDRGGNENVWWAPLDGEDGEPRPVTDFMDGRVLWPSISRTGDVIAFERDFGIWTLDGASGTPRPVDITLLGVQSRTSAPLAYSCCSPHAARRATPKAAAMAIVALIPRLFGGHGPRLKPSGVGARQRGHRNELRQTR